MELIDDELPSAILNLAASKYPTLLRKAAPMFKMLTCPRSFHLHRTSNTNCDSNLLYCARLPVHCSSILFYPKIILTNLKTAAFHRARGQKPVIVRAENNLEREFWSSLIFQHTIHRVIEWPCHHQSIRLGAGWTRSQLPTSWHLTETI